MSAMFRRLFGRTPVLPEPDTDRAYDDLDLRAAREQAVAGDWAAAKAVIDAAGPDWELRARRIMVLAEAAPESAPQWLDAWLAAEPEDPTAVTLHAAALDDRAGDARGS